MPYLHSLPDAIEAAAGQEAASSSSAAAAAVPAPAPAPENGGASKAKATARGRGRPAKAKTKATAPTTAKRGGRKKRRVDTDADGQDQQRSPTPPLTAQERTAKQHALLLRPWRAVLDVLEGASVLSPPPAPAPGSASAPPPPLSESSSLPPPTPASKVQLRAFILTISALGRAFSASQAWMLLDANAAILDEQTRPPFEVCVPDSLVGLLLDEDGSDGKKPSAAAEAGSSSAAGSASTATPTPTVEGKMLRSLQTRMSSLSRLIRAMDDDVRTQIPQAVRSDARLFAERLTLQQPQASRGETEQRTGDPQIQFAPPPTSSPASTRPREASPPSRTRTHSRSSAMLPTSAAPLERGKTLEASMDTLPDVTRAYSLTSRALCPHCNRDCQSFTELLVHWVAQCAPNTTKTQSYWCGFCRRFYSCAALGTQAVREHRVACALDWAAQHGWVDGCSGSAAASGSRTVSKKRQRERDDDAAPRPCAVTLPNFFARRARSEFATRTVDWYFCPDCILGPPRDGRQGCDYDYGHGHSDTGAYSQVAGPSRSSSSATSAAKQAKAPKAASLNKAYAIHRTPNVLAQHYQDHLLYKSSKSGGRCLPPLVSLRGSRNAAAHYDPPWLCTFPGCGITVRTVYQRVHHLATEHGIPLLVDWEGWPIPAHEIQSTVRRARQLERRPPPSGAASPYGAEHDRTSGADAQAEFEPELWSPEFMADDRNAGKVYITRGKAAMGHRRPEAERASRPAEVLPSKRVRVRKRVRQSRRDDAESEEASEEEESDSDDDEDIPYQDESGDKREARAEQEQQFMTPHSRTMAHNSASPPQVGEHIPSSPSASASEEVRRTNPPRGEASPLPPTPRMESTVLPSPSVAAASPPREPEQRVFRPSPDGSESQPRVRTTPPAPTVRPPVATGRSPSPLPRQGQGQGQGSAPRRKPARKGKGPHEQSRRAAGPGPVQVQVAPYGAAGRGVGAGARRAAEGGEVRIADAPATAPAPAPASVSTDATSARIAEPHTVPQREEGGAGGGGEPGAVGAVGSVSLADARARPFTDDLSTITQAGARTVEPRAVCPDRNSIASTARLGGGHDDSYPYAHPISAAAGGTPRAWAASVELDTGHVHDEDFAVGKQDEYPYADADEEEAETEAEARDAPATAAAAAAAPAPAPATARARAPDVVPGQAHSPAGPAPQGPASSPAPAQTQAPTHPLLTWPLWPAWLRDVLGLRHGTSASSASDETQTREETETRQVLEWVWEMNLAELGAAPSPSLGGAPSASAGASGTTATATAEDVAERLEPLRELLVLSTAEHGAGAGAGAGADGDAGGAAGVQGTETETELGMDRAKARETILWMSANM